MYWNIAGIDIAYVVLATELKNGNSLYNMIQHTPLSEKSVKKKNKMKRKRK
jgi:hypothetical protein